MIVFSLTINYPNPNPKKNRWSVQHNVLFEF